jgi:hypothetical protein
MYTYNERKQPSLLNLLFTVAVILVFAAYGMIALSTEDPLWFWPVFDAQPVEIVVHCYGEPVSVSSTDAAFHPLAGAVNEMLSAEKRWDPLTLSDTTYTDYMNHPGMSVIEFRYQPAVRVHSIYKYFSNVDTLLIPIEGRHAQWNAIFGRFRDQNVSGSLMVESKESLIETLQANNICISNETSLVPSALSGQ